MRGYSCPGHCKPGLQIVIHCLVSWHSLEAWKGFFCSMDPLAVATAILEAHTKPLVRDLLASASTWNDDQLYLGVSHMLKAGADVSDACKAASAPKVDSQQPQAQQHEVAWLTQRVATRTLALLLKQRSACMVALKHYTTLRAAVLSNKEYTLLFLVARGADFNPHLDALLVEAIRGGAPKAIPWLLQWQEEVTSQKLQKFLQDGLPEPTCTTGAVAAVLEVLLLHGLSPNCTLRCSPQGGPPTKDGPALDVTLLEWAVLHAASAAKLSAEEGRGSSASSANDTPAHSLPTTRSTTPVTSRQPSSSNLQALDASTHTLSKPASNGCQGATQASVSQLVKVVLHRGADVNANSGAALARAAETLQGELVGELVSAGADVALPRVGAGQDLLRWAVDTKQCPASSGVLQALLGGVKPKATAAAEQPQQPVLSRPTTPPLKMRRSGENVCETDTPQQQGGSPKGTSKSKAATPAVKVAPLQIQTPLAANAAANLPVCEGVVTPMITLGGSAAEAKRAAEQQQAAAVDSAEQQKGSTTNGRPKYARSGSFLPAAMLTELQRDEAFLEAVQRNDLTVVQCLLEAGADVHYKQDKAILLAMGAIDTNSPDTWMPRPRDRAAVLSMSRPMVELLLEYGADVNARGGRALCQAARWKDDYSMKYILSLKGADASLLEHAGNGASNGKVVASTPPPFLRSYTTRA